MMVLLGERSGRGIVTDAITTPVVNTSAYFFKKTIELIDFKVCNMFFLSRYFVLKYWFLSWILVLS